MNKGANIQFVRKKQYTYIKPLGQGGTGKTILIKDEVIDEVFVCKKYSPYYPEHQEQYFKYFIDEIKLLHTTYHENIVRVFNYYLYPELKTGYILMEFIDGKSIDKYIEDNPEKITDIFLQVIEGFKHLEEKNILHRDIRPENILISNAGFAKIIDFGFGKTLDFNDAGKSISLNWRYSVPDEFGDQVYDSKTEVYFVGKLFEEFTISKKIRGFKFEKLIQQMIAPYEVRTSSFFNVYRGIVSTEKYKSNFNTSDRTKYHNLADNLLSIISKLGSEVKYVSDADQILKNLEKLYQKSQLEKIVVNNDKVIEIFIQGQVRFFKKKPFNVSALLNAIQLFSHSSEEQKRIILNNLWERFDSIELLEDDLPF